MTRVLGLAVVLQFSGNVIRFLPDLERSKKVSRLGEGEKGLQTWGLLKRLAERHEEGQKGWLEKLSANLFSPLHVLAVRPLVKNPIMIIFQAN